ncbi:DUF934 domain-containing protein [Halomonas sp. C05BenzN]|uniref:DUF934 domain-containing protein n=1 Tax=Halomonas sp. C05BenzN TaxID=3411041 RepID=UPI003B947889
MPDQAVPARPFIRAGQPAVDDWTLVRDSDAAPSGGRCIVPLPAWQSGAGQAPWLASDTELTDALAAELLDAPLIAIDFPKFTDGRGYSLARLLRERHGYAGEIRAIGDVLVDQLYFMTRCGFDALSLREDQWLEDALGALGAFSRAYQPAVDQPEPLFRRREREWARAREKAPAYA